MKYSLPLINWALIEKKQRFQRIHTQKAKIRLMSRQLYYKYKDSFWILDDESNFTLNKNVIKGNDNFF